MNGHGHKVRCARLPGAFSEAWAAQNWHGRGRGVSGSPASSSPHRLSLAGCSPAEPASVSPVVYSIRLAPLSSNVCCPGAEPQPHREDRA